MIGKNFLPILQKKESGHKIKDTKKTDKKRREKNTE